ncbi:hypothetical protein [Roseococcus sp.]|uniref:hypothetical protein n=1 Tax=Roseococcus sp. TaxID=2109646 RepID=UPI003BA95876
MRLSNPLMEDATFIAIAASGDAGWFLAGFGARVEEFDRDRHGGRTEDERIERRPVRFFSLFSRLFAR